MPRVSSSNLLPGPMSKTFVPIATYVSSSKMLESALERSGGSEDPPTQGGTTTVSSAILKSTKASSKTHIYEGDVVIRKGDKNFGSVPSLGTVVRRNNNEASTVDVKWEFADIETSINPDKLSVVDRTLLRNTRVVNPDGLVGTVNDFYHSATVQVLGTKAVVQDVPLERLKPITWTIRGQEVLYEGWVGVITSVKRNIWFQLDGGMAFYVQVKEEDGFARTDPYFGFGMPCPGIRTKLTPSLMRNANWTSGPMKILGKILPPINYLYSFAHVTLTKSEVVEIEVKWAGKAPPSVSDRESFSPPRFLTADVLKSVLPIGIPATATVGINSVRRLRLAPDDSLTLYNWWLDGFRKEFIEGKDAEDVRVKPMPAAVFQNTLKNRRSEFTVQVLSRRSILDVTYPDGSTEEMLATKAPMIVARREDSEFPAGMVVSPLYTTYDDTEYYGVVIDSDFLARRRTRKVKVIWLLRGSVNSSGAESVFNLKPHPLYAMFQRGTILFPSEPGTTLFRSATVSDMNLAEGRMIVTTTLDHAQYEVYPHQVLPMRARLVWSLSSRSWVSEPIIIPPYQLSTEWGTQKRYVEVSDPSPSVLNNNNRTTLWDEVPFDIVPFAPEDHRYFKTAGSTTNSARRIGFGGEFRKFMNKEMKLLTTPGILPKGVWVRCYENRMDLVSLLMIGPASTPYEDGIFMFDLQLHADAHNMKRSPPKVNYVSYSYELSPYMGWDGNFCVSALPPLSGASVGAEGASYIALWAARIQGLIFSYQPLLGGPKDFLASIMGEAQRAEIARRYNEFVVLRVMDSSWNMIHKPHDPWGPLIRAHFGSSLPTKLARLLQWSPLLGQSASDWTSSKPDLAPPSFPLTPVSDGFLEAFNQRLDKLVKISPSLLPLDVEDKGVAAVGVVVDVSADQESIPVPIPVSNSNVEEEDETVSQKSTDQESIIIDLVDPPAVEIHEVVNPGASLAMGVSPPSTPIAACGTLSGLTPIAEEEANNKAAAAADGGYPTFLNPDPSSDSSAPIDSQKNLVTVAEELKVYEVTPETETEDSASGSSSSSSSARSASEATTTDNEPKEDEKTGTVEN